MSSYRLCIWDTEKCCTIIETIQTIPKSTLDPRGTPIYCCSSNVVLKVDQKLNTPIFETDNGMDLLAELTMVLHSRIDQDYSTDDLLPLCILRDHIWLNYSNFSKIIDISLSILQLWAVTITAIRQSLFQKTSKWLLPCWWLRGIKNVKFCNIQSNRSELKICLLLPWRLYFQNSSAKMLAANFGGIIDKKQQGVNHNVQNQRHNRSPNHRFWPNR